MLTKDRKTAEFTLRQYLYRQRATLHGLDERAFKELPKVNIDYRNDILTYSIVCVYIHIATALACVVLI